MTYCRLNTDRSIRRCIGWNAKGWIAAKWQPAGKDLKREFKYYQLTTAGQKQLVAEEWKWNKLTQAVARIMRPAEEG